VALTAKAPRGLVAAFNFAGGRGSRADHDVCKPDNLIHAYRDFGKHSRTSTLCIYAQNDKFFWPELAQQFDAAFSSRGRQDQFVLAPAIGEEGHSLFRHVSAWSATVDDFLKAQNLTVLAEPLPELVPPNIPAPSGLREDGLHAFQNYLLLGPHKALATSEHSFGLAVAQMTVDDARRKAVENFQDFVLFLGSRRGHGIWRTSMHLWSWRFLCRCGVDCLAVQISRAHPTAVLVFHHHAHELGFSRNSNRQLET
jgi:hypothetical protein